MSKKTISGLGVVIASVNRPEILKDTLSSLALRQTVPEMVVVSITKKADWSNDPLSFEVPFKVVFSDVSSSAVQRNRGVSSLPSHIDIVVFLDDDMEIHDLCMEEVRAIFDCNLELAAFSGSILANGNISRQDARAILNGHTIPVGMPDYGMLPNDWPGLYGCCMCIRRALIDKESFDENLPLYAIGEDTEVGFRLSKFGKVGGSARCQVVHLAVSSGRISEIGVGYAQVINYIYFAFKKIGFPLFKTLWERIILVPGKNFTCWALPFLDKTNNVDRAGRFFGNILAIRDFLLFRVEPSRLVSHILKPKSHGPFAKPKK